VWRPDGGLSHPTWRGLDIGTSAGKQLQKNCASHRFAALESLRLRTLAVGKAEDRNFASLVIYALRRHVNDQERQNPED
jgi:hypothetical protein